MRIEQCTETGICSIVKDDGRKVDLISAEASLIKGASGDEGKIRDVLATIDNGFEESLSSEEIAHIASKLT